jgi:hypothetical protein
MGLAHDTVQWQTFVEHIHESSEYLQTGNYLVRRVSIVMNGDPALLSYMLLVTELSNGRQVHVPGHTTHTK